MVKPKGVQSPKMQKINEVSFPLIKQMIDSGAFKPKQIKDVMGISSATFYHVKSAKDLDDYRAQVTAQSRIAKQKANDNELREKQCREAYETAVEEVKADNVDKVEDTPEHVEIQPNFNEVLLEQILAELKEINKKLSQAELLQQVQEEEEDERPVKRSFFGLGKPF